MLTDDDKKLLTELLGEVFHGYTDDVTPDGQWRMCTCGYAYIIPEKHRNRTFATWKDLGDLKEKIVEMGEWESFLIYAASTFSPDREMKNFTNYLLDPTRFSELVARWWEERKVKEGEGMNVYQLNLFERLILLVIMQVMYIAGIPVRHREELSSLLYRIAKKGQIEESDLEMFQ